MPLAPTETVVNRKEINRDEWLDLRRQGLGASDAATTLGLAPWEDADPYSLYLEKTGQTPVEEDEENEAMKWGRRLEPTIREAFSEETGKGVHRDFQMYRSVEFPYMLCNLDGKVEHEPAAFEAKTVGAFAFEPHEWGEEMTDEVPAYYLVQCQHQLSVTGYERVYLAVLIGSRKFRIYCIERDERLIGILRELEGDFWDLVENEIPPEIDYMDDRAFSIVRKKHDELEEDLEVNLPDRARVLRNRYKLAQSKIKKAKRIKKAAKAELFDMTGTAATGHIPGGGKVRRWLVSEKEIPARTRDAYISGRVY